MLLVEIPAYSPMQAVKLTDVAYFPIAEIEKIERPRSSLPSREKHNQGYISIGLKQKKERQQTNRTE